MFVAQILSLVGGGEVGVRGTNLGAAVRWLHKFILSPACVPSKVLFHVFAFFWAGMTVGCQRILRSNLTCIRPKT